MNDDDIARSIRFILVCLLMAMPFSAVADEPELEPIPLPAPSTAADDIVEPRIAIRPDDEADTSSNSQVEQATFDSELDLQPIPTTDPPIVLQSPVIESAPVQSAPPIVVEPPRSDMSTVQPTIIESSPSVSNVEVPRSSGSVTRSSRDCQCQTGPTVRRQVIREQSPPHRSTAGYTTREYVQRNATRPSYQVPSPHPSYQIQGPRVETRIPADPRELRYDSAGPYAVRQSTQVRPGPGRSAVQVTTYEVTRYRPTTYQVAIPRAQRGYVMMPAYQVPVQPYPPVPPVAPVGPVRSWLRGR